MPDATAPQPERYRLVGLSWMVAGPAAVEAAHVVDGPGSTDCGTTRPWSWWLVARCRLLIGRRASFKFKFDRLNSKNSRFYR
jgi:hypothetical protein